MRFPDKRIEREMKSTTFRSQTWIIQSTQTSSVSMHYPTPSRPMVQQLALFALVCLVVVHHLRRFGEVSFYQAGWDVCEPQVFDHLNGNFEASGWGPRSVEGEYPDGTDSCAVQYGIKLVDYPSQQLATSYHALANVTEGPMTRRAL
jgi:hypothetical protein